MPNPQQLLPAETSNDEMSICDLAKMFCASWRLILATLAATLLLASIYLVVKPAEFEAKVTIGLGQVSNVESIKQIESDADVLARVRSAEFQNSVVESLGWRGTQQAQLLKTSYRFSTPSSGQLEIRLRGFSSEEASKAANASVAVLAGIHNDISNRILARLTSELSDIQSDIADSQAFLRDIERFDQRGGLSGSRIVAASLLKDIRDEKIRLRNWRARQTALEGAMAPELFKPTMALEPVLTPDTSTHPNARRVWGFAAFAGIILGLLLATLRSIKHTNRNTA